MNNPPGESEHIKRPVGWDVMIAACVVAAIVVMVYLPCLDADFVDWDDDKNIVDNTNFRGLEPRRLLWMFTTTHMGPYQPLSWLTLGVDYTLWGMNPRGYHLTNILLHAAGAGVLCMLTVSILTVRRERTSAGPHSPGVALAGATAALGWALHPQHVESVAWVTERRDVLSGLFYLLCLWSYVRAHRTGLPDETRHRWERIATAFCALALLSKATGVSIPVVLLVLDVYPLGRLTGRFWTWPRRPHRRLITEKLSYVLFSALAVGVGLIGQVRADALRSLDQVGLVERLAIFGHAVMFYVGKTIWPADLAPLYPRPGDIHLLDPQFLVPCLGVAVISAGLILLRRRWPGGLAAWTCYVIVLLPVSGLITIGDELVADRYSHLPTMSLFVLLGGMFFYLWLAAYAIGARFLIRLALTTAAAGVVAACTWQARQIIPIWRDSVSLWMRATDRQPGSHKAWNNLGASLSKLQRFSEAERACRRAVDLKPDYGTGHYNLGVALSRLGRSEDAVNAFAGAVRFDPNGARGHANLGTVLIWLGKYEQAVAELKRALELDAPKVPNAHFQLGEAYRKLGRFEEARDAYRTAITVTPRSIAPLAGLADVSLSLGRISEAEEAAIRATEARPDRPEGNYALAQVQTRQGRLTHAIRHLRIALTNHPSYRDRAWEDPHLRELRLDPRFETMMRDLPATRPATRHDGTPP